MGSWGKLLLLCLFVSNTGSVWAAVVCNAGFAGENSAQILMRLPQALADCGAPTEVVIFVGMNDAVNEKRFLTPLQTAEAVQQMLQVIGAAHAKALVVTVHAPDEVRLMQRHSPGAFGGLTPAERIDATNRALRKAAQRGGADIVDFHAALALAGGASTSQSTDGVHLTQTGYRLLAKTVAAALPREVSGRVLCLGDSLTFGTGVRAAGEPDAGSESYPQQLKAILNGAL
ncbi:SGNH/GDSL hydrolase family protein [Terriglobus roseus]|uniref:Acyl-CoA thioesterase-1 n=1 Tax=Terriglobus roseus TaxID=392734 RepID=A0A1H4JYC6_9BACT|nr:GDSL-type esterase/lipase family protein [Terriglobus roseus]SEB50632.1 acyl-CoA thioesterase-1 [Terriglobus roseus]